MGLTHVAVTVRNLVTRDSFTASFLIDTGATASMAPTSELNRIGIEPISKTIYEHANGQLEEFHYGFAEVSFMDETTGSEILFGPDGVEPFLGVIALESVGITVDPANQRLKKLPALSLK